MRELASGWQCPFWGKISTPAGSYCVTELVRVSQHLCPRCHLAEYVYDTQQLQSAQHHQPAAAMTSGELLCGWSHMAFAFSLYNQTLQFPAWQRNRLEGVKLCSRHPGLTAGWGASLSRGIITHHWELIRLYVLIRSLVEQLHLYQRCSGIGMCDAGNTLITFLQLLAKNV